MQQHWHPNLMGRHIAVAAKDENAASAAKQESQSAEPIHLDDWADRKLYLKPIDLTVKELFSWGFDAMQLPKLCMQVKHESEHLIQKYRDELDETRQNDSRRSRRDSGIRINIENEERDESSSSSEKSSSSSDSDKTRFGPSPMLQRAVLSPSMRCDTTYVLVKHAIFAVCHFVRSKDLKTSSRLIK